MKVYIEHCPASWRTAEHRFLKIQNVQSGNPVKNGGGRGPLQLVVANYMEDVGLEVIALEGSASILKPGVF